MVKSNRFDPSEESACNTEIYRYLKHALNRSPSLFNAIDLDVISVNGRRGFSDFG